MWKSSILTLENSSMCTPRPVVLLSDHSVGSTCLMIIPPVNGSDRKTYQFGKVCDYFPHECNSCGWPVMQLALKFYPASFDLTKPSVKTPLAKSLQYVKLLYQPWHGIKLKHL